MKKDKLTLSFIKRLSEDGLGMLLYISSDGFKDPRVSRETITAFKVSHILKKFSGIKVKEQYQQLFKDLEENLRIFTK